MCAIMATLGTKTRRYKSFVRATRGCVIKPTKIAYNLRACMTCTLILFTKASLRLSIGKSGV